ncbi:MAG: CoA pyrophosphatase [Bacteroidota bacterium]
MIPSVRLAEFAAIPEKAKKSSVLLLLYKKRESIFTILILRPEYDGVHSKQVSFPGGGFQASDITLENTALRETMEEIGIASSRIQLMGSLSELYIPPSNFVVKPFVGFTRDMGRLTPDKHEVEEIIEADINQFMGNRNIKTKKIRIGNGQEIQTPYYDVSDFVIWGATAMILREFSEICSEIEI